MPGFGVSVNLDGYHKLYVKVHEFGKIKKSLSICKKCKKYNRHVKFINIPSFFSDWFELYRECPVSACLCRCNELDKEIDPYVALETQKTQDERRKQC